MTEAQSAAWRKLRDERRFRTCRRSALGGLRPSITAPEEFPALIRAQYVKYGRVVRSIAAKID